MCRYPINFTKDSGISHTIFHQLLLEGMVWVSVRLFVVGFQIIENI